MALKDTLGQMDLIDNFRAFHPKEREYTYISNAHRTFSGVEHMLRHKTSLNKLKKIEIISSIFSDHSAMKLEINPNKNSEKHAKTWKLNNMLLNNEWVNNEVKEEMKNYLETNEHEDTTIQPRWETGKAEQRGKFTALQAYLKQTNKFKKK